ncbi:MAG: hypothetical protein ABI183_16095 [Polyangiaceae bacterium]
MIAIEAFVVVVNLVLLALVGAERLDKTIFYRFVGVVVVAGLGALKLGILHDQRAFVTLVAGVGILDLALVAIFHITIAVRRRQPRAKGNILTRLQNTYSPVERRLLPEWDRPELADVTRELEKQGFHACGDFEEVERDATHGPMRAFLSDDCNTAAFAFLREDSRKNIQPTAVSFLTELSDSRWVLTDPMPSRRSFATLDRPPNVHRSLSASGWSPTTAAKAHATHVAKCIAAQGGAALVIENTFAAWCSRRDAYWAEVCAHRKKIGFITETESMTMFGNDRAHREVVRLLKINNRREK